MATLLDRLRTLSVVSCDTLDVEVAERLGPFADCTSNQLIAVAELSKVNEDGKLLHQELIQESIQVAHWQFGKQADATLEELAVELMIVALSIRMAPHITGFLHVQTNPKLAYNTHKTVKNAERIIAHFKQLAPDFPPCRICIKIPATWEGLQACRELERKGIATLATTVFSLEQTALAADAGCRYVAPYVNELRVYLEPDYIDPSPSLQLCTASQRYIDHLSQPQPHPHPYPTPQCEGNIKRTSNPPRTQVLAASLTTPTQALHLAAAGVSAMTLSPVILASLASTPAAGVEGVTGAATVPGAAGLEVEGKGGRKRLKGLVRDESAWRLGMAMAEGGRAEGKVAGAVAGFVGGQGGLEEVVRSVDPTVKGE